jgi:predicted nucleotidyltransferase
MATARDTTLLPASVCVIRDNRRAMLVFATVADVAHWRLRSHAPFCGFLRRVKR